MKNKRAYEELESWYSGVVLQEQLIDQETGKMVDRYPIQINPLRGTCLKHAAVLFGLTIDSMHLGGLPFSLVHDKPKKNKKKSKKAGKDTESTPDTKKKSSEVDGRAEEVIQILESVFENNNAGSMLIGNAITSQYLGGSVLAARWRPDLDKIEITSPGPDEFFGIPDGTNYFRLKEAWIVREITYSEAKTYRPEIAETESKYYYTEQWTEKEYEIAVNGITVTVDGKPYKGVNPFNVVPMVYIPHIRDKGFLGKSLITNAVKGLIKEMNLRFADIGDAISDDAHGHLVARNIAGTMKVGSLADGRKFIDLGSSTGMTANESPDMFAIKTTSASEPMLKFSAELDALYRREVDHPAVADGEDQGSQRSSLTLNTRMWPLVSHVELERSFWAVGIKSFLSILLTILMEKGKGITETDMDIKFAVKWPPMLPRDREVLVNEISIRSANELGSKKHLMGLFDDIENPEDMWEEIMKEKEEVSQMALENAVEKMKQTPMNPAAGGNKNPDAKSGVSAPPSGSPPANKSSLKKSE